MAFEAKTSFLEEIRRRIAPDVSAEAMPRILKTVAEVMDGFDIQEMPAEGLMEDDLIEQYAAALKVEGRSQQTIDRYLYTIGRTREQTRGIKDTTLEGNRQVYSAFYNWLQRESLIDHNPTANLGAIKCAKRKKQIYSEIDIEKLNQHCGIIRDRAIIAFLGSTGCRISEMTGLNRDEVNLEKLECVVHGKGNKERTVFISPVAGMLVREYLQSRTDDCEALFAGKGGKRFQPGGVRAMLNRIAKEAGVEHVHPHKFRRTLATNLTRHGMAIQEVATILGHEKLDTTMKYVVLNNEDIKNAYRRFA